MLELSPPDASAVVLIGCHTFEAESLEQLPAVANNLTGLAEALTDPTIWGISEDRLIVLDNPQRDVEVLRALRAAESVAKDTLVVYYAGHGLIDPMNGELYLALPGSQPDDVYVGGALPFEAVRRVFLDGQAEKKVLLLDCCYSGRAMVGEMSSSSLVQQLLPQVEVADTCLITSSAENSLSVAPSGERYTAFTGELLSALRNGIPGAGELLDMRTLYEHISVELKAKSRPRPQQRIRNNADRICIARNRAAGEPAVVARRKRSLDLWPAKPAPRPAEHRPGGKTSGPGGRSASGDWGTWLSRLATPILTAVITGVSVVPIIIILDGADAPSPAITSAPPDSGEKSPSAPLRAAPIVQSSWNASCARRYLDQPADRVDPAKISTDPDVDDPVVADDVWLDISVKNESDTELHLTGIRIEEVYRETRPLTGILLRPRTDAGCAEGFARYAWNVKLDEHKPILSPVDLSTPSDGSVNRIAMPYPISSDHPETFRLYFTSHGCACRFRVVMDWERDGEKTVPVVLPEDGKRFFVVPRGKLPAYHVESSPDGRLSVKPET